MDLEYLRTVATPACERFGVRRLHVFGSVARGDEGPESDVDLLVELEHPELRPSKRFLGLLHYLEDHLERPVDLLTASSLTNPYLRRRVLRERVPVYERRDPEVAL